MFNRGFVPVGGEIEFVGFVPGTAAGAGGVTLDASSLGIQTGDLVFAFIGNDEGAPTFDSGSPFFWTDISTFPPSYTFGVAYTVAQVGMDFSSVPFTDGGYTESCAQVVVFRNASYVSSQAHSAPTGDPNPPSIGTDPGDWVLVGGWQDDDGQTIGSPTDYTLIESTEVGGGGSGCAIATAYREDPSSTEDPGTMASSGDDQNASISIVISPL